MPRLGSVAVEESKKCRKNQETRQPGREKNPKKWMKICENAKKVQPKLSLMTRSFCQVKVYREMVRFGTADLMGTIS